MPAKKSAATKYQSPKFPAKVREAASEFALAGRARKKIGKLAFGKPKSSKIHREYHEVDGIYQRTGRKLAKMTGYAWKTKHK
jgi:hypothetical protein